MNDPRAAESAEHLQTAARELIRAARSFLDLVEDVVEDPDRLAGAASSVAGMVRDGLNQLDRNGRSAAWADPAWTEPAWEPDVEDGDTVDLDDLYEIDDDVEGEEPEDLDAIELRTDSSSRTSGARTSPSRVRRIAVE